MREADAVRDEVPPLLPRATDKRTRRPARFRIRQALAFQRRLPDFLVIGEMKCATSSFFSVLSEHPGIAPPFRKETHFFTKGYSRGTSWYRAHFPKRGEGAALTGEATPDYLFDLSAPERVAELLPHAKLLVLLRDPVERAISHYHHEVRMGRETLELAEALAVEEKRIEQARGTEAEQEVRLHASYAARGNYAGSLRRWLRHFDPSSFHVVDSADFQRDPGTELARATDFLGIARPSHCPPARQRNAGSYAMPPDDVIRDLRSRFEASDKALSELLGREMSWMRP